MIACLSILAVGCSDDRGKTTDPLTQLDQSPASDLRPDGELAEILAIGSTYTNVQRENNLLQVRGKTVQWNLPVYDVKRHGAGYRVQTIGEQIAILESRKLIAGAMVYITPRTDAERLELEAFRTGDIISFKGVIHDITLRTVEISPARLTPYPYLSVGAALSSQSLREDASSLLAQEEDQELRIAFGLEERNTKGRLTIYHIANNSKTDYLKNLFESDIRPVTIGKLSGYTAPALKLKIGGVTVQQYAVAFFREKVDGKINFGLFVEIDGAESAKRIWCGLVSSERKSLKIEIVGPTHWAGFTATKLLKLPTDVNLNCQ
jgi:hypothetical protein